jgi:hypothetical protein
VATERELWTARKVFRRFIEHEHEREHYAHMVEVLDALGVSQAWGVTREAARPLPAPCRPCSGR